MREKQGRRYDFHSVIDKYGYRAGYTPHRGNKSNHEHDFQNDQRFFYCVPAHNRQISQRIPFGFLPEKGCQSDQQRNDHGKTLYHSGNHRRHKDKNAIPNSIFLYLLFLSTRRVLV